MRNSIRLVATVWRRFLYEPKWIEDLPSRQQIIRKRSIMDWFSVYSYIYLREFVELPSSWPPARVEGRSEQHLLTPLSLAPVAPRAPRASSEKLIFEYSFVNLTHFSVKDVHLFNKIDKIHKIHAPKIQGRVFSEEKKTLRDAHRPRGGGREPKIGKKRQHPQDTCSKNPGACFFRKQKAPAART
mgnify:CR=1 FL=1